MDTRAESVFRIWPLRTHHSMACWMLLNFCGRERRKLCMLAKASIAVPSTTSITAIPITDGINSMDAMWTHIAPPIEWPIIIIGGAVSGYNLAIMRPTSLETRDIFEKRNYMSRNPNENNKTATLTWPKCSPTIPIHPPQPYPHDLSNRWPSIDIRSTMLPLSEKFTTFIRMTLSKWILVRENIKVHGNCVRKLINYTKMSPCQCRVATTVQQQQ